jgi:hypothetical protein
MIEMDWLTVVVGLAFVVLFLFWRQRAVTSGFQSDWRDLCSKINLIWSTYHSGYIETPTEQWDLISTRRLYIRSCYKQNLEKFTSKRDTLASHEKLKWAYIGTSGIGKSGFLQLLLVSLVKEAKEKGVVHLIRLKMFSSDKSPPKDWLLHTNGRCSVYNDARVVVVVVVG